MQCQTDIAEKIIEMQADYVLAVKDNQKYLHEQYTETTPEHGRIETWRCYWSTCFDALLDALCWKSLKSIGMVECGRIINGKKQTLISGRLESRKFITLGAWRDF